MESPGCSLFLRQSVHSDYCAVYAGGMLLSILGQHTDRADAVRLFGADCYNWQKPDHSKIRRVLMKTLPNTRMRWLHYECGDFTALAKTARRLLGGKTAVLTTGRCIYGLRNVAAEHAFLITAVEDESIYVLDSLGRSPQSGQVSNASFDRADGKDSRLLKVRGSFWSLDLRGRISFLSMKVRDGQ